MKFDRIRSYRIGFQGNYSNKGFSFKARPDVDELLIDINSFDVDESDLNLVAQCLMFRFADLYLRQLPESNLILKLNTVLRIFQHVMNSFSHSHIYWDSMGCGTRSLKLIFISEFLTANPDVDNEIDSDLKAWLKDEISLHAVTMSSFKMPTTNHGLQGLHALVLLSKHVNDIDHNQAVKNLVSTFKSLFNDAGFYLENSAEYHFYAQQLLEDFLSSNLYTNSELVVLHQKALEFNKYLFADQRHAFGFGDSDKTLIYNQSAPNKGRIFCPDLDEELFYCNKTGISLSRKKNDEGSFDSLFLTNLYHNKTHNHHDYLSFEWFNNKNWIVIDPGKYTYNPGKYKDYFVSDLAHNTIALSTLMHNHESSLKSVNAYLSDSTPTLSGAVSDSNFIVSRELRHLKDAIVINDTLSIVDGNDDQNISSNLNISNIYERVDIVDQHTAVFYSEHNRLIVTTTGKINVSLGECKSRLRGWFAPQYGIKQPCYSIEITNTIVDSYSFNRTILKLEINV